MAHKAERITTRGVSVRSYRGGGGPPLVFLHGAGGLPPMWLPFFETLSAKFDVLVPEHPGFGASDDPEAIKNIHDLAYYYLDFFEALDLRGAHLIGNSMGGWTAAELAVRSCSRLASLTLISPAGVRIKGIPVGDNFIWAPDESIRNLYYDQAIAERLIALPPPADDAALDSLLQNRLAATKFGWEPRWLNPSLEKWLHRISVPTHVLWGNDDKLLPAAYAKSWSAKVPNCKVSMIEHCGHLPHIERADVVADSVLTFLAGVRA